jgi:Domain of unknown function (DUF222)
MFELLEDAGVVDAIGSAACEENAACGRRLMAIAELYARRAPEEDAERINWAIDGHANVVAEISAALNISRGRAAGQLRYAIDLRERLPKVAKVFATGAIDFRMMAELVNRGANVTDPDLLANLDAAFAQWAPTWMKMSGPTLTERIDMWVAKFDPTGVREPRPVREDRYVEIGPISPGMAGIWAKLPLHEGAAFDTRLDDIAATVCHHDPRTTAQRRADALGAIATGQTRLACGCGDPECPTATPQEPLAQVVIEVIADHSSLEGSSQNPGYLPGFGAVPAPMLREMAATAQLRPVPLPPPVCQPGYRPSTALARFIRCRDLTCRFPGCDAPAQVCDIDHTIPYPLGPTHPSNLKLLCRFHHLLKTFYTGVGGWADRQLPDGTVIWTAPSGQVYTTKPGGALFFPALATPTGQLVLPESPGPAPSNRGLMMPTRQRTRAQERAYRIALERQHNAARITRKQLLLAERIARDDQPPPF